LFLKEQIKDIIIIVEDALAPDALVLAEAVDVGRFHPTIRTGRFGSRVQPRSEGYAQISLLLYRGCRARTILR
jgi:hypothetical protein